MLPTSVSPTLTCLVVLKKSRDFVPNPHLPNPWQREVGVHHVADGAVPLREEAIGVGKEIAQTSAESEVDSEAVEAHIVDSLPDDNAHRANFETENRKCDVSDIFVPVVALGRNHIVLLGC